MKVVGHKFVSSGHTKTKTSGDIEWGPDPEASSGFLCGCYQQELVGQGNCFWEFHNMKIINNSTVRGTPFIPCFVVISSLSHVQLFWDPVDCSPPGSSVHGISQAWIMEWVAISFSMGSSQPGIEPMSPASPALAGGIFTTEPPGKPFICLALLKIFSQLCNCGVIFCSLLIIKSIIF